MKVWLPGRVSKAAFGYLLIATLQQQGWILSYLHNDYFTTVQLIECKRTNFTAIGQERGTSATTTEDTEDNQKREREGEGGEKSFIGDEIRSRYTRKAIQLLNQSIKTPNK